MKKFLSFLLVILTVFSLLGVPVSAAVRTEGLDCTAFTADQSGDGWQWSHASKSLILKGLELRSEGDGIVLPNGAHLRITGSNSIDAAQTGVRAEGILYVEGSGSLDILADGVGFSASTLSFQSSTALIRIQSAKTGLVLSGGLTVGGGSIHSQSGMQVHKLNACSVRESGGMLKSFSGTYQSTYPVAVGKAYTVSVAAKKDLEVTGGGEYLCGESVSLSATPADKFASWTSDQVALENEAVTGFVMPAANVTVTANAVEEVRKVPVRFEAGEGGSILTPNGSYPVGSVLSLEAKAEAGYAFVGWTADDGSFSDAAAPDCEYTVGKKGGVVKAEFRKLPAGITITATEGGSAKPDSGEYTPGTQISLEATPLAGYRFVGWEASAGELATPEAAKCLYTVPAGSALVTARFVKEKVNLTVSATEGGTVSSASGEYAPGTRLTLKATPSAGWVFAGWEASSGTLISPMAQESAYEVPAENASVVARFAKENAKEHALSVLCEPFGAGTLNTAGGRYTAGSKIALSVTLKDPVNYMFVGWSCEAGGEFSDDKSSQTTFTMPEGDAVVKALFVSKINNLTVTATEGGKILLETGEYVDHLTPLTEDSRADTKQTFVAEALEGYYFTGWSISVGELADSASSTLRFVMPASPVVLTANFTKASYELSVVATAGGSVNTSGGRKSLGATVELVATPKAGYRFAGWAVKCADPALEAGVILAPDSESTTMIMPAGACRVTAQFASLIDGSIQTTAPLSSQSASSVPGASLPGASQSEDEDAPVEQSEGLPGWLIILGAVLLAALGVLLVIHRERRMRSGHVSVYKELFAKHNMKNLQKQETRRLREQSEEKKEQQEENEE